MAEIDRKTQGAANTASPSKSRTGKNVLNRYRSYSYVFTLAVLSKTEVNDPTLYRDRPLNLVILKSGGKGTTGLIYSDQQQSELNAQIKSNASRSTTTAEDSLVQSAKQASLEADAVDIPKLISKFNQESPGRFDMFIEDLSIESLMSFSPESNLSLPTSIKFTVIEPYSINGFMEALHVSSVTAGYPNYVQSGFVLKMEFMGYPDDVDVANSKAEVVENSVRYFPFIFTGMSVDITESGTRYQCSAVPLNEKAFGQPNVLKNPVNMHGSTVADILNNLANNINEQVIESDKERGILNPPNDRYEIKFPDVNDKGELDFSKVNKIGNSQVSDLTSNKTYTFPTVDNDQNKNAYQTGTAPPAGRDDALYKYDPSNSKNQVQFNSGRNIHECISSLIRDSTYVKNILKTMGTAGNPDDNGMIDYFLIRIEVTHQGTIDEKSKKPFQVFRFVVTPYKIHYTSLPGYNSQVVDQQKLGYLTLREYNYVYTGQNIDVISFKLDFNTLFFEAIPNAMGVQKTVMTKTGIGPSNTTNPSDQAVNSSQTTANQTFDPPKLVTQVSNQVQPPSGGASTAQSDPYSVLAKNMHEAIINSKASMLTGDLEILGDPFFLVTGGMGNYKPKPSLETPAKTLDDEAAQNYSEVFVNINFRNPYDIGTLEQGGTVQFDSNKVPFSGVYRVLKVESRFKEGKFTQLLNILRVPGQPLNSTLKPSLPADAIKSRPNPLDQVVPDITLGSDFGSRPSILNLLTQQARGLPSPGLPGILSNFTAAAGGLGGAASSLLNQVSGAVTNGIGKLTSAAAVFGGSIPGGVNQLASGIRLQASGLLSFTQQNLGNAALISQAANTLQGAFPITNAATQLTSEIVGKVNATSKLISVPGSGIGEGATVKINSALTNQLTPSFGTVAVTDLFSQTAELPTNITLVNSPIKNLDASSISAALSMGASSAGLAGGITDKLASLTALSNTDPTAIASKFGINASQISGLSSNLQSKVLGQLGAVAKTVPDDVDLTLAVNRGLVLDYIPANKMANIPATIPNAVAPPAEMDQKYLAELTAQGGAKSLANAFGVSDISKISADSLPSANVSSLLSKASFGNPLTSFMNQNNIPDASALSGKLASASSQISGIVNQSKSVESSLSALGNATGYPPSNITGVANSVVSKFGSISQGSSPIDKLMLGNNLIKNIGV